MLKMSNHIITWRGKRRSVTDSEAFFPLSFPCYPLGLDTNKQMNRF